ncbi:MAG: hypothetical protein AUI14_02025 [Actinobacteria bacterium 13_2_20CM_2_71_6]|nr:MAG: hypothetical protein AUI14_02025 [Actinobacteria bacterium 13_2_20CM_2_71_6]
MATAAAFPMVQYGWSGAPTPASEQFAPPTYRVDAPANAGEDSTAATIARADREAPSTAGRIDQRGTDIGELPGKVGRNQAPPLVLCRSSSAGAGRTPCK